MCVAVAPDLPLKNRGLAALAIDQPSTSADRSSIPFEPTDDGRCLGKPVLKISECREWSTDDLRSSSLRKQWLIFHMYLDTTERGFGSRE